MKITQLNLTDKDYPDNLRNIPSAPKKLYCLGAPLTGLLAVPAVAIVGSRKISPYGKKVTSDLAHSLARRGITIVSGLAIGVDGVAHQAALEAGGKAIAVLPSGLDKIYPASNRNLAKKILQTGGTLVTEYPLNSEPFQSNFVARNRIVSGLSAAVVITEAALDSGSLHTANFALEQGREVCAVPGNITSPTSEGTNNLIKNGATLVSSVSDILLAIGLADKPEKKKEIVAANHDEHLILTLINDGLYDSEEMFKKSGLDAAAFNQTLSMLEITGKIKAAGSGRWFLT